MGLGSDGKTKYVNHQLSYDLDGIALASPNQGEFVLGVNLRRSGVGQSVELGTDAYPLVVSFGQYDTYNRQLQEEMLCAIREQTELIRQLVSNIGGQSQ